MFLVDAAQTVGHLPLDVQSLQIDLLAAPGHKGLLGPLGTGFLYIHPTVQQQLQPLRQGGTGSSSHEDRQPETLPDKFEAGNLNVPGLAGVAAACDFLQQRSVEKIHAEIGQLTRHCSTDSHASNPSASTDLRLEHLGWALSAFRSTDMLRRISVPCSTPHFK